MTYLLDTNACIAVINGRPPLVRTRLREALDSAAEVLVPVIAAFELWYGVAKSSRAEANARLVETFLSGPVRLLSMEEEDAKAAGLIRAALEVAGRPIGAYDVLIAGQAVRNGITLVTANAREFRRVKGLTWEDWAHS
jgi:tRNA(fMet)-specific endonuclease VapC